MQILGVILAFYNYSENCWSSFRSKEIIEVENTRNKTRGNFNDNVEKYYHSISVFVFETIIRTRYKLFINWINIFPISIENYKLTNLYNSSFQIFNYNIEFKIDESNNILPITLKEVLKKEQVEKMNDSQYITKDDNNRNFLLKVDNGNYTLFAIIAKINELLVENNILWRISYSEIENEFNFSFTDESVNNDKINLEYISLDTNVKNSINGLLGFSLEN